MNHHGPKPGDVQDDGYANKERLKEEAEKLFTRVKQEMTFVNFYQLKQFANLFGSLWGFVLVTQGFHLKCFYASSATKKPDPVVSPSRQRDKQSM